MPVIYSISRRSQGGLAEIHVRFYNGRACDLRARTRIYAPVSIWNTREGRCNISRRYESADNIAGREAQQRLDELAQRITNQYAQAGGRVDKEWLQRVCDGATDEQPLADIIDAYCAAKNIAPRTIYKLHSLRLHIRNFEQHRNRRLYAHTITADDLRSFARYLRGTGIGQNALASRMRQLRALVYYGGRPYPNPFDSYTMPQEVYADPFFLTADERDRIASFPELTNAKAVQRDIFIFQCHTGCRVSDLYALTENNIKDGWLVYSPQKTARESGRVVEVPLSQTAQDIVARYHGVDLQGRLLPFIADIHYNQAIRDILRAAGIDRPIMWRDPKTGQSRPRPLYEVASSHLARRTFSQIAYASTSDKRLVASMTGHSENSRAFNRYSEITRDMKKHALGV